MEGILTGVEVSPPIIGPSMSGPRMSSRCRPMEVIEKLKSNLNARNIRRFKGTCFGRFIELSPLVFQGRLLSMILEHLVDERSRLILKFKFRNVEAKFGREEFFMLTGLSFGREKTLPTRSNIHDVLFHGDKSIYLGNIEYAFENECKETGGNSENAFKLGLLLFVYGCIMGDGNKYATPLDLRYMHAVDYLLYFDSLPWGSLAYNFFVTRFYSTCDKWMSSLKWNGSESYDVNGLNLVLQWWLYEAFPVVASNYSDRVDKHVDKWPRMLRWWSIKIPHVNTEDDFVDFSGDVHYVPMKLSPYEEERMKVCSLEDMKANSFACTRTNSSEPPKRKLEFCDEDVEGRGRRKERFHLKKKAPNTPLLGGSSRRTDCEGSLVDDDVQITKVVRATPPSIHSMSTFEREMIDMVAELKSKVTYLCENVHQTLNRESCRLHEMSFPECSVKEAAAVVLRGFKNGQENMDASGSKCDISEHSNYIRNGGHNKNVGFCATTMNESELELSAPMQNVTSETTTATDFQFFDPLQCGNSESVREMREWLLKTKEVIAVPTLRLPLGAAEVVEACVFERILNENQMLRDEHVDLLLNLVMYNASVEPSKFHQDWACLDHHAWASISAFTRNEAYKLLVRYAEGSLPRERQIAWTDVSKIYGIAHVMELHWVAYEVDFIRESVVVYDSMSDANDWQIVAGYFIPFSKFLPWICKKLGILKKQRVLDEESEQWEVVKHEKTPQQETGYDCGVMACKIVECLASGRSIDDIVPRACTEYRDSYCGQLWEIHRKELQTEKEA